MRWGARAPDQEDKKLLGACLQKYRNLGRSIEQACLACGQVLIDALNSGQPRRMRWAVGSALLQDHRSQIQPGGCRRLSTLRMS